MALLSFLNHPFFSPRYKPPLHLFQAVLIAVAMGLSAPRLFAKNQPRTRANTIALGMGAKSLIILAYMLLTEYVARFRRWHSYKANAILSGLEIVFWGAVAALVFQANLKSCKGILCGLSWGVVGIAVMVNQTEIYVFAICMREFREYKAGGKVQAGGTRSDEEEMQQYSADRIERPRKTHSRHEHRQPQHHGGEQNGWQARGEGVRPQRGPEQYRRLDVDGGRHGR